MVDTFSDNLGMMDFTRSQNGSGMSSRGAGKKFLTVLQSQVARLQRNTFSLDEMKSMLNAARITVNGTFLDFISSLNHQGNSHDFNQIKTKFLVPRISHKEVGQILPSYECQLLGFLIKRSAKSYQVISATYSY